jgi:hypothetical protein
MGSVNKLGMFALGAPGGLSILTFFVDKMAGGAVQAFVVNYDIALQKVWGSVAERFPELPFDLVEVSGWLTIELIAIGMVIVGLLTTGFQGSLVGQDGNASNQFKGWVSVGALAVIMGLVTGDAGSRPFSEFGIDGIWVPILGIPLMLVPMLNWRAPLIMLAWAGSFFAADFGSTQVQQWIGS